MVEFENERCPLKIVTPDDITTPFLRYSEEVGRNLNLLSKVLRGHSPETAVLHDKDLFIDLDNAQ